MSRHTSTKVPTSQAGFWKTPEFATRLREERNRTGLNQKEFGGLAGATLDSQSRYETGKNQPNAEYLAALARAGVDVMYVLTGERGRSDSLGADESRLLTAYWKLTSEMRAVLLTMAETMIEKLLPPAASTLHGKPLDYHPE
ncbi:MAG: helix-turn-helix domain-containing protein [Allosphingosinicella sp.]|uniref:helix-turn-helix domain-containing protein n=1 Tax=Allosphingosinicella sp. TaxID=2823234 RepID=UPI00394360EF